MRRPERAPRAPRSHVRTMKIVHLPGLRLKRWDDSVDRARPHPARRAHPEAPWVASTDLAPDLSEDAVAFLSRLIKGALLTKLIDLVLRRRRRT